MVDSTSLREAAAALNRGEFSLPAGQILVVKVFLGNVATESGSNSDSNVNTRVVSNLMIQASTTPAHLQKTNIVVIVIQTTTVVVRIAMASDSSRASSVLIGNGTKTIKQGDYPEFDAVYRVNTNDAKQREWFVFDNRLVLPEYLIEFDLITQATREEEEGSTEEIKSKEKEDENAEEGDTNNETKVSATVIDEQSQRMKMAVELLGRKLTAQEVLDMGPLLRPLKRFMHQCKRIVERSGK